MYFNHYDTVTFYSDNKGFIKFTDENLKPKVQIEDEFIYIMNYRWGRILILYSIYR